MISRTAAARPGEPGRIEAQPVLQAGAQPVLAAVGQVELVGRQDAVGAVLDGRRDRLEPRILAPDAVVASTIEATRAARSLSSRVRAVGGLGHAPRIPRLDG